MQVKEIVCAETYIHINVHKYIEIVLRELQILRLVTVNGTYIICK